MSSEVNLSDIDMNLLVALDALLAESHVTNAAQRLGLTQSAMSHALRRLRVLLTCSAGKKPALLPKN